MAQQQYRKAYDAYQQAVYTTGINLFDLGQLPRRTQSYVLVFHRSVVLSDQSGTSNLFAVSLVVP